jgi:hypothetical protein
LRSLLTLPQEVMARPGMVDHILEVAGTHEAVTPPGPSRLELLRTLAWGGIVLVLVFVLDLLGFCGEKGIRFPPNDFVQFNLSDGETSAFSSTSRSTSARLRDLHKLPTSGSRPDPAACPPRGCSSPATRIAHLGPTGTGRVCDLLSDSRPHAVARWVSFYPNRKTCRREPAGNRTRYSLWRPSLPNTPA